MKQFSPLPGHVLSTHLSATSKAAPVQLPSKSSKPKLTTIWRQLSSRAWMPALVLTASVLWSQSAQAADFNIPDGDVAALKTALTTANSNGEDDTINLAAGGIYTLTTVDNKKVPLFENGLPVIEADGGHALTINGNGARLERSSAAGTSSFRLVFIDTNANVNISGLTLTNGRSPNGTGGGIYNTATLTVTNCTISGNSAQFGGGIVSENETFSSVLTVINSTISGNSAFLSGGGIFNRGTASVSDSTLNGNSSSSYGGGITNANTVSKLTVTNCTLSGNNAHHGGGSLDNNGTLTVLNSTLSGGNIYNNGPRVNIGNTILATGQFGIRSENSSSAVVSQGHNLSTSEHDRFHLNAPSDQSGIDPMLDPAGLQDHGGLTKTIALLDGSPAMDAGNDNVLVAPLNLTTDQRGTGYSRKRGQHVDIGAYEDQDPALIVIDRSFTIPANVSIADAFSSRGGDGSKPTYHLVNAAQHGRGIVNEDGTFSYTADAGHIGTDSFTYKANDGQRDSNLGTVTITVLENVSLVVTTNSDASTNTDNITSLREAISYANSGKAGDAPVITFAPSVTGTITLAYPVDFSYAPTLVISHNVTINGPGADKLAISGDNTSTVFLIDNSIVSISGLKITSGRGNGGVQNNGTLAISHCTISDNSGYYGGGITNYGTLTVSNSTISGNSAEQGGAIYNNGTLTVNNSTISDNIATIAGGIANGDVQNVQGANLDFKVTLNNCTLSDNGQGIVNTGKVILSNTILDNNVNFVTPDYVDFNNIDLSDPNLDWNNLPMVPLLGTIIESQGYNLSSDNGGGYLTATGDQINTNPLLEGLADKGGPTQTMALEAGSPAINAGDPTAIDTTLTDQRGTSRIKGGRMDIGAFESDFAPIPTNTTPTLKNEGLTLDERASATINNTSLQATDAEQSADQLTFTLTAAPVNGTLKVDGTALAFNGTFTQADIDGNKLTYGHNSSETTADTFKFTVSDGQGGNIGETSFNITIKDKTGPSITAVANPSVLWSPNNKLVPVAISGKITDMVSGIESASYKVTDSEGLLIPGGDIKVQDDGRYSFTVNLLSRKAKQGTRVYKVEVTAVDGAGNTATKTTTVTVPHDNSPVKS